MSRICQGAPGVICSPVMNPSRSQRCTVAVDTSSSLAALAIVTISSIVAGGSDGSGGDLVVGAQPGDAVGGERVAGAGQPSLAGEDRGDLLVGVALGELAHERDRVLVGAARVAAGARQGTVCSVTWPPSHTTRSCAVCCSEVAVDGHDDVGEDRAQQLLALAVAGGGRVEHLAQVRAGTAAPRDLLVGERVRALGRDLGQRALGGADLGEALLPFALERAGDEPVLGLAGVELAPGALGVDLRALELQLGRAHPRVVISVGVLDRAERRLDPGRCQRLEDGVEHDPLDPPPADRLAALGAV